MSDWSMYELEDIAWDEFTESGDHIVPHPSGEQGRGCDARGDCAKKTKREAVTVVRKSPGGKSITKDATEGNDETSFPRLKYEKAPMLENSSWSQMPDSVFPDMCDVDPVKEEKSPASDDVNTSDNCFKSSKIDSVGNELGQNDAILANGDDAIASNLCRFPLDDISPTESDLGFFGSGHEDKESCDLLYYGWPDIGNFDDVDRMFRSCDSTFGQGTASNDEELSWFSSRDFNGSEHASKSGYKSSHAESCALNSTSKRYEDEMKLGPGSIATSLVHSDKKNVPHHYMSTQMLDADDCANVGQSFENWLNVDAEDKRELLLKKKGHEVNQQTGIEDGERINLEGEKSKQSQLGGQIERGFPQYLRNGSINGQNIMQQSAKLPSAPSASQVFPSPSIVRQEKNLRSEPFGYPQTYIPCVSAEYNYSSHQIPVTPTTSNVKSENNCQPSLSSKSSSYASNHVMPTTLPLNLSPKGPANKSENKIKRHFRPQQTQATMSINSQQEALVGQAVFSDQNAVQKQLYRSRDEAQDHGDIVRAQVKLPVEVDSSTVQEGSCVSSALSDDISLQASTFRQLQYVMEQLDVRTKLCIRDSLYRLARNAAQRCNSGNPNNIGIDSKDTSRLLTPEESDRYTGFMDIETDTNPIDRSIAYLLFHRPSDPSTKPPNDALSLIHGSILGQPLMHENMVSREEISGSDTKFIVADRS